MWIVFCSSEVMTKVSLEEKSLFYQTVLAGVVHYYCYERHAAMPKERSPGEFIAYNNISYLNLGMIYFHHYRTGTVSGDKQKQWIFFSRMWSFLQNDMWHMVLKARTLLWSQDSLSLKVVCQPLPPAQQQGWWTMWRSRNVTRQLADFPLFQLHLLGVVCHLHIR